MAAQNAQEKNLPATPRKLEKAKEEGQVARSRDLGHFAAIGAGGAVIVAAAPTAAEWLKQLLIRGLNFDAAALQSTAFMNTRLTELAFGLVCVVLPFGAVMMIVAAAGGFALSGWTWSWKPLGPKFAGLNPFTGVARLLSKRQLIDAGKASLLALILGAIGAAYLKSHVDAFSGLLAMPLPAAIAGVGTTILGGLGLLLVALALFAFIDVPLQIHLHAEKLKMSFQEVKQENKEAEGNAEVKGKMRARMREMTKRRMMAAVPTADLVVMNPTHYAVALKYEDGRMAAPRVVAKGADLLALRIRELAEGAQVPVLEAPVLARALYAHAELDREIPAALFAAVAQVLAYVYQLRAAMAGGAMPGELPHVDVPAELDPHHDADEPDLGHAS